MVQWSCRGVAPSSAQAVNPYQEACAYVLVRAPSLARTARTRGSRPGIGTLPLRDTCLTREQTIPYPARARAWKASRRADETTGKRQRSHGRVVAHTPARHDRRVFLLVLLVAEPLAGPVGPPWDSRREDIDARDRHTLRWLAVVNGGAVSPTAAVSRRAPRRSVL